MAKSNDIFKLPPGPAEICFDKNEFMKKTFTVDEFLHNHRNAATLETIRDDLGIYLKVLRSAMIELINEDYADFVNLSSDLVGLDQSIGKIQMPLQTLKDEITSVRTIIVDTMQSIDESLTTKRLLHEQLRHVQSFIAARQSTAKLHKLLDNELCIDNDASATMNPIMLERAAMELVRLKHDLTECESLVKRTQHVADELNQYDELRDRLLHKIEVNFLRVLSTRNCEHLERCLQVYCTLGAYGTAEDLFRREIVAPYMHDVISETALQNSPHGLSGIYKQIVQFVDDRMKQLLQLTQVAGDGVATVSGFEFMLNSFWTEVERRLETHMASIFAPGYPDLFYQKYKCTNEFLDRIEAIIQNEKQIERLRTHPQYKQFQTKWNLPVYFQIRFQEIGGAMEITCSKSLIDIATSESTATGSNSKFRLKPFAIGYECVRKCWATGVYLPQLFNRFLKFSLQLYSRLASWIDTAILADNWPKTNPQRSRVDFLVHLYTDIIETISESTTIAREIVDKMPIHLCNEHDVIEQCMNETRQMLAKRLNQIEDQWNREMLKQTSGWVKQVADIPRLYRKTNREAPTKPCNYVELILKPAKSFKEMYATKISDDTIRRCLIHVLSQLNKQYFAAVTEALTSAKRTEESLRRLKNVREKPTANSSSSNRTSGGGGMSDDDKIRLQLHVDIVTWTEEIERLNIERHSIEKLDELNELAQSCTGVRTERS